jgi:thioglycine synthase
MRLTGGLQLVPREACHHENGLRSVSVDQTIGAIESLLAASSLDFAYQQILKAESSLHSSFIQLISPAGPDHDKYSYGKGITSQQAFASAFMEFIERFCARRLSDDHVIVAAYEEIIDTALDPQRCVLPRSSGYMPDQTLEWVWGRSLTQEEDVLVPANMVYLPYEHHPSLKTITYEDSNGLASGNCLEEAILHALLELIERDTAFIVEYNRLVLPDLVLDAIPDEGLSTLLSSIEHADLTCHIKDARHDLGIATFSAFLQGESTDGKAYAQAWGTHLNPGIALSRSLTEALQMYPRCKNYDDWRISGPLDYYCQHSEYTTCLSTVPDLTTGDIKATLDLCVDRLQKKGVEVIVVDLSMPDLPFAAVRVVAPGLQPYTIRTEPRLSRRLLSVPVKMGYHEAEGCFSDLKLRALCGYGR